MDEKEFHPVAELFPLMTVEEMDELRADIRENGLREKIVLYQGKIIDGRNRYRACLAEDIEPEYRELEGEYSLDELIRHVVSLNLHRRHLTSSQKAAIALDVEERLEEEAEQRRRQKISESRQTGETSQFFDSSGNGQEEATIGQLLDPNENKAAQQAAKMFNTNRQYVSDAKLIKQKDPEAYEMVRTGAENIPTVKKYLNLSPEQKAIVDKAMTQERVGLKTALSRLPTPPKKIEMGFGEEMAFINDKTGTLKTRLEGLYSVLVRLSSGDLSGIADDVKSKKEMQKQIGVIQDKLGQMAKALAKEKPKHPPAKKSAKKARANKRAVKKPMAKKK